MDCILHCLDMLLLDYIQGRILMNKKNFTKLLLVALIGVSYTSTLSANTTISSVKHYDISISKDLHVPYNNTKSNLFKDGFVTGFGSAVTFKGYDEEGNPQFYAITDRGPNADAPTYISGSSEDSSKIFPAPNFTPSIGILTINNNTATINESIALKNSTGQKLTGLPLAPGLVGSTNEVALDENLNTLGYDANGLDTEGIAIDKEGNFWVCDEYGPFLAKFNSAGKLLEKYEPGKGLPEILSSRIPNRGFEGLSISPSGKIFVSVQSVLDVDSKTSKIATFTRIIEFNPTTKKVKTYAYPINTSDYKNPKACKIGDIYAISDTELLVIEQGTLKDKSMRNAIYKVDLGKASDITNTTYEGKALEYVSDSSLLTNCTFATKSEFINLRSLGWTAEKAEGICLFNNNKTIAVINDNDFGLTTTLENPDITDYIYDPKTKTFTYSTDSNIIDLAENTEPAQIWTIELAKPLK